MKQENRAIVIVLLCLSVATLLACDIGSAFNAPNPLALLARATATPIPPTPIPPTPVPPTPVPPTQTPFIIVVTATPPLATLTRPAATLPANPFGAISFAPGVFGVSPNSKPMDAATRYPEGVAKVYALFQVNSALQAAQWRYEWYLDGQVKSNLSGPGWDVAQPGSTWANVWRSEGIEPGEWEFRLIVGNQVAQKNSLVIEKRQPNAAYFATIRFAEDNKNDQPVNPHDPDDAFSTGTRKVWAFFDVSNLTKGTTWKWEWSRDGERIANLGGSKPWDSSLNEKDWWLNISDDSGLKPGTYELKLYVGDRAAQLGTFVIE